MMKRIAAISTICALFLFAGAISAFAQDEHQEKKEEVRQEEKHDQHVEEKRADEHAARRISDEHFRAHFGREHHFAVGRVAVVNGERRFAYGGYNFVFAQPWPAGWAYTDDCYIDYVDGGYFLFNVRHPGVRIALTVGP
jgi:Ni/Co efflux regulator RcnB